jgi:hypothetical protein
MRVDGLIFVPRYALRQLVWVWYCATASGWLLASSHRLITGLQVVEGLRASSGSWTVSGLLTAMLLSWVLLLVFFHTLASAAWGSWSMDDACFHQTRGGFGWYIWLLSFVFESKVVWRDFVLYFKFGNVCERVVLLWEQDLQYFDYWWSCCLHFHFA